MKLLLSSCLVVLITSASAQDKYNQIRECIVENGTIKEVTVDYNTTTAARSVVVNGVRKDIEELYPYEGKEYAAKKVWFINSATITVNGAEYKKYGLPRVLGITEIKKFAVHDGITVFEENGGSQKSDVLYVPVRRGCEYQPYVFAKDCVTEIKLTSGAKSIKPGEQATVTAALPPTSGKYVYQWTAYSGTITGDAKSKTVTVQSAAGGEDDLELTLLVTLEGGKCTGKQQNITIPLLAPRFVSKAKRTPVQVLRWDKVPQEVHPLFWTSAIEQQVLKVLSKEEFDYAKAHVSVKGWSAPVRSLMEWRTFYKEKMEKLKTYEVASFDVAKDGKIVGKASLIVVPYEENKTVLESKKPLSDFYILMAEVGIKRL